MLASLRWAVAAAAVALSANVALTAPVHAAVPEQQHTQVPGWYRARLGADEITALYDGYLDLPTALLKNLKAGDLQALLAKMFVRDAGGVQTAISAYLVHTGSQLVLVDSGAAACFGPTLGNVGRNLRAAGYEPAQVDAVLITHAHPDHVCGLRNADGTRAYPNATVYLAHAEDAFWNDDANQARAPEGQRPMFAMTREALAPYRQAQRLQTFEPGATLPGGIVAVDTHGHTPGHTSYRFKAPGGEQLIVLGDLVHSYAVQFARPEVAIDFDADPRQAITARRQVFDLAAKEQLVVAGEHLPFPGLGHIRRDGKAYAWVPVEFGAWRDDR